MIPINQGKLYVVLFLKAKNLNRKHIMPLKEGFSDKTLSFGEKQNTRKLISQYTHCLSLLKIREKNINKLDSLPSVSAHKGNFYSKQC